MGNVIDRTGQKFGRLEVIKRAENTRQNKSQWFCKCNCGNKNMIIVSAAALVSGTTKSCGCLKKEMALLHLKQGNCNRKHCMSESKLYYVWKSIKARCNNPNSKDYKHYGAKGISICTEWETSFIEFYNWAMNNGYKEGTSIDRIDVNGNYCHQNCRFVDSIVQANNRSNNHFLTHNGETHTIAEWSRITGIKYNTIIARINKLHWTIEKALSTPA